MSSMRETRDPGLPRGFFYVHQDNYCVVTVQDSPHRYLYSDSATSCIIVILQGRNLAGEDTVLLAHISDPQRFEALSEVVDSSFSGPVQVWAQGANPHSAEASVCNVRILMRWLSDHAQREQEASSRQLAWSVERVHLALGQGEPGQHDHHAFGIDLERRIVSNKAFKMTPVQRDPTGGAQVLFAMFGASLPPRLRLWNAEDELPLALQCDLVTAARKAHWTRLVRMSDDDILYACSSTPTGDVPWFSDTLRMSAQFVEKFDTSRCSEK